MRILLDESLPIELRDELPQHFVRSAQEMSWSALKNGELLLRAAGQFDVFVTADQNLQYQQNLQMLPVAVAVLVAKSNRIQSLKPLVPQLLSALASLEPRTLIRIGTRI
jgi:predicted nuclease of predicted toxin-antitoxin system